MKQNATYIPIKHVLFYTIVSITQMDESKTKYVIKKCQLIMINMNGHHKAKCDMCNMTMI